MVLHNVTMAWKLCRVEVRVTALPRTPRDMGTEDMLAELRQLVGVESQVVSYRWAACHFRISAAAAKRSVAGSCFRAVRDHPIQVGQLRSWDADSCTSLLRRSRTKCRGPSCFRGGPRCRSGTLQHAFGVASSSNATQQWYIRLTLLNSAGACTAHIPGRGRAAA
jgi:hypothetical protein